MYGRTRAQLWGAVERGVCFYVLCTSIHQHMEPTVVVLLFMPKGSHFAGIYTAYRERQRNLAAHHYRTFLFFLFLFFFSARPPVHFGDHELTGTKKKASLTSSWHFLGKTYPIHPPQPFVALRHAKSSSGFSPLYVTLLRHLSI